jgi:Uncharacterized protein family UPF0029/RWD domain
MDSLEDELLAVDAIFPECISRDAHSSRRLTIHPFSDNGFRVVSLTLLIPAEYPENPPVITGYIGISQSLAQNILDSSWTPGEVCLYVLVDKLRELPMGLNANVSQCSPRHTALKDIRKSDGSSSDDERDREYEFAISEPIVDRKSTFVGRAMKVHSRAEARAALLWLKQHNKKIARATHNIVAWRVVEDGILMQGICKIK